MRKKVSNESTPATNDSVPSIDALPASDSWTDELLLKVAVEALAPMEAAALDAEREAASRIMQTISGDRTRVSTTAQTRSMRHNIPSQVTGPGRDASPRHRVVLVDGHSLYRAGVRNVLSALPDFEVIGEAGTVHAAFAIVDDESPDAVLMDIALPDAAIGLIATKELRWRAPATKIIILTNNDTADVVDAFRAGAAGYILKSDGPDALARALRSVMSGERYVAPSISSFYQAEPTRRWHPLADLSAREREVLRLAADCLPPSEIARKLCVSRAAIGMYLHRINRKLGVRTLAELVRLAASPGPNDEPFSAPSDRGLRDGSVGGGRKGATGSRRLPGSVS